MNVHANWHNYQLVSDEIANRVKKNCGCKPGERLRAIHNAHHRMLFKCDPPPDKVAWRKETLGQIVVYSDRSRMVYTNPDGTEAVDFEGNSI